MKCPRCGMPLSPTKSHCPRCGLPIGNDLKHQGEQSFAFTPTLLQSKQQSEAQPTNTFAETTTKQLDESMMNRGLQETYSSQPPLLPPPPLPSLLSPTPLTPFMFEPGATKSPTTLQETPTNQRQLLHVSKNKGSANLGYALAGLCTTVAAILLLFVYILVQTLPQGVTNSQLRSSSIITVSSTTPTLDASPTAIVPTTSPTATYPGQQYISNAQTAQFINATTGEPTTLATTFSVGQKIYISFQVHPAGQVGAICLLWYLNTAQFASYPFSLNTTSTTSAYSYAVTEGTGKGYVEIYWETTPSCFSANKLLGDRVNFTVTA